MENNKRKITLYDIVAVGLLAAFVFIATFFFKIKIPTPGGSTMVKLGNGICLLAGTLLGGWRGGLAAGMAADCFLISLDRIELAGAQFDPLSLLGTVGLKGPVDYTIVNGVAVGQNGELVTADEGELAARANAAVCRYLGRC